MGNKVYKSDAGKLQILDFYENILKKWPVPCEKCSRHVVINCAEEIAVFLKEIG